MVESQPITQLSTSEPVESGAPVDSTNRHRLRVVLFSCLVVVLVILATFACLYSIPLATARESHISWFGTTMKNTGGPQPGNTSHIPTGFFCLPSNAVGNGEASFIWQTLGGNSVVFAFVALAPLPTVLFSENGSYAAYAFTPSDPVLNGGNLCSFPSEFTFEGRGNATVTLTFLYNYTTSVPIL